MSFYKWCGVVVSCLLIAGGCMLWRQIKIAIVPHHTVVALQRKATLDKIAKSRLWTKKIVLLSTDHFSLNQHMVLTTKVGVNVFGDSAVVDEQKIYADHGIVNVQQDLMERFVEAKIYPVIIGSQVDTKRLEKVKQRINSNCGFDCLMVASVDFSHYLPYEIAQTHDRTTVKYLNNLDELGVKTTETDSPQVLSIAINHAKNSRAVKWHLDSQTNSGAGSPYGETTGHVYGWYTKGWPNRQDVTLTFTKVFVNDTEKLDQLNERLYYGSDVVSISSGSGVIVTGWEGEESIVLLK